VFNMCLDSSTFPFERTGGVFPYLDSSIFIWMWLNKKKARTSYMRLREQLYSFLTDEEAISNHHAWAWHGMGSEFDSGGCFINNSQGSSTFNSHCSICVKFSDHGRPCTATRVQTARQQSPHSEHQFTITPLLHCQLGSRTACTK